MRMILSFKSATIIFLGLLAGTIVSKAQTYTSVENLDISAAQQTYAAPVKNKSVVGESISVAGEKYKTGIGVHSYSNL